MAGLEGITIMSVNLLNSFKEVDITKIRQSNQNYDEYGAKHMVENLAWSSEQLLTTSHCALRDKVREDLVGISLLDTGGPLFLKIMLKIVMDVDIITL